MFHFLHANASIVAPLGLVCVMACASTGGGEQAQVVAKIHYDLGVNALAKNDLRAALRELLQAETKDPKLPQTHNALGLVYHAMGRLDDALEHYERAVALKTGFSEAHNNLGALLIDLGRYDAAIEHFQAALDDILYPSPSLAEGNMGWAYFKKGESGQARKHLRNAVATNPKFCRGYEWLARMGLDQGDPAQVVSYVQRFKKHCEEDPKIKATIPDAYLREMHYYLGLGYLQQGQRVAARETFGACAVVDADGGFGAKCAQSLQALK